MPEGVEATSVVTPKLLIYTDGGFPDVEGFSLGNIVPEVVVVGKAAPAEKPVEDGKTAPAPTSNNVAILALQTRRSEEKSEVYQVFGRVHNYRGEDVETEAKLLVRDPANPRAEGVLRDAVALKVPARGDSAFKFDLPESGASELEVRYLGRRRSAARQPRVHAHRQPAEGPGPARHAREPVRHGCPADPARLGPV